MFAIIPTHTSMRAEPQQTVPIQEDGINSALWQTILHVEAQPLPLPSSAPCRHGPARAGRTFIDAKVPGDEAIFILATEDPSHILKQVSPLGIILEDLSFCRDSGRRLESEETAKNAVYGRPSVHG